MMNDTDYRHVDSTVENHVQGTVLGGTADPDSCKDSSWKRWGGQVSGF